MSAGELILTNKLVNMSMVLRHNESAPFGNAGNAAVVTHGPSRWLLNVETERLSQADARLWRAWTSRRGGGRTFTAWDLHRINPAVTPLTADGSIAITVDSAASTIELTGVGVDAISIGDMVSYRTLNNGFCLLEAQEAASPASGVVEFEVRPRPLTPHASVPAVRRVQALGEFRITTDLTPFDDYVDRSLQFEAIQQLR